jgi:tRNA-dihydrouridine synthase
VTVKCRLGVDEDKDYEQFRAFIDRVASAGSGLFVVHARNAWLKGLSPKENREVPPLRYDWAYRLKAERPDLQVVLNGGIASVETAQAQFEHLDGVMLGRAAYHDPYVLHALEAAQTGSALRPREELLQQLRPTSRRDWPKAWRSSTSANTCWACSMASPAAGASARC